MTVNEARVTPDSALTGLDGVQYIHPNFEIESPQPIAEDSILPQNHGTTTYGLDQIETTDVWDEFGTRGSGARVAVLDTGVDASHPDIDLAEGGWAQFDAEGNQLDTEPNDPNGHGTHVSGTVAGGLSDALNAHIGVAPDAELYHGKVLNNGGTFAQIISGMEWAVQNEADVINMSLGGEGYAPEFIAPVRNAFSLGTFVVVSSGNSGPETSGSPGNVYDSYSIGATGPSGAVASFSSGEQIYTANAFGDSAPDDWPDWFTVPDVAAPGVQVISAQPGGGYAALSGTSMAAPHTTGAAALTLSANPDATPTDIERLLTNESVHPRGTGRDTRYGAGIINVFRSVTSSQAAGEITGTVTTPAGDLAPQLTVATGYGTTDVTDSEGSYSIPHPEGTASLSIDGFGVQAAATDVTVDGTTEQNLTVESVVDATVLDGQPPDMAAGSTFDIGLRVANLESLGVSLTENTTNVAPGDITLTLDGQSFSPGGSRSFSSPVSGEVTLTVAVASDVPDEAVFALEHTFTGPGEDVTVVTPGTGQTLVLQDPTPATFEITDPNFDTTVGADRVLGTAPTISNTGDLTATQDVTLVLNILGTEASFPTATTLAGGEQTQVDLSVSFGDFPRSEGTQTIETSDDSASSTFVYQDAAHRVQSVSAPSSVTAGSSLEVEATVENIGELDLEQGIAAQFAGRLVDSQNVSVVPGETGTVTFSIPTQNLIPGTYTYAVIDPQSNASTGEVTVEEATVPLLNGNRPTDPDNDGVYEDLNGNGEFDIGDIQALFNNLESETVQNNPSLFDFNNNGSVDIGDVQALYQELSSR